MSRASGRAGARESSADRRERDEVERLARGARGVRAAAGDQSGSTGQREQRDGREDDEVPDGDQRDERPPGPEAQREHGEDGGIAARYATLPSSIAPPRRPDRPLRRSGRRIATPARRSSCDALRHRAHDRRPADGRRARRRGRGGRLGRRLHVRRDRDRRPVRCTTRGSCSRRWRCGPSGSRLGAIVFAPARRRPWKLAREAVSLDVLSNGRLVLPVGLGALDDAGFGNVGEPTPRARGPTGSTRPSRSSTASSRASRSRSRASTTGSGR